MSDAAFIMDNVREVFIRYEVKLKNKQVLLSLTLINTLNF